MNIIFKFIFKEHPQNTSTDLVFIIGAAGDNKDVVFNNQKKILVSIMHKYIVDQERALISIIMNGNKPMIMNYLNGFQTFSVSNLLDFISNMPNKGDGSNISLSMRMANDVFLIRNGARPQAAKFVVIMVDSIPEGSITEMTVVADELYRNGAELLFIVDKQTKDQFYDFNYKVIGLEISKHMIGLAEDIVLQPSMFFILYCKIYFICKLVLTNPL